MQIQLTLSPSQFMWFLPDSSLHLSEEDPGPKEIDFTKLPLEYKRLVALAVLAGNLKCNVSGEELAELFRKSQPITEVPPLTQAYVGLPEKMPTSALSVIDVKTAEQNALKIALTKNLVQIKNEFANCVDLPKLRTMLELEQAGQKRKGVIKFLSEKIAPLSMAVAAYIAKSFDPHAPVRLQNLDQLADEMQVSDGEEEEKITLVPENNCI